MTTDTKQDALEDYVRERLQDHMGLRVTSNRPIIKGMLQDEMDRFNAQLSDEAKSKG